jgi:Holliday junction resolvase-like predicted endonuclease
MDMSGATKIQSYHVGIAAEGFAAGFLAHAGYEVLVQYGANQPEYDLVARKEKRTLTVSVKGTQENGWGLTHSYLKQANYFQAIDDWLANQKSVDIFMLVSVYQVAAGQIPNLWVARPREIAEHLKRCRGGKGNTTLFIDSGTYVRGIAKGVRDEIPESWRFSQSRIDSI